MEFPFQEGLCSAAQPEKSARQLVWVPQGAVQAVHFVVVPLALGSVMVEVRASVLTHGLYDSVRKIFTVQVPVPIPCPSPLKFCPWVLISAFCSCLPTCNQGENSSDSSAASSWTREVGAHPIHRSARSVCPSKGARPCLATPWATRSSCRPHSLRPAPGKPPPPQLSLALEPFVAGPWPGQQVPGSQ